MLDNQLVTLENVLESMGHGLIVVDETGRFLIFNTAAKHILGYGSEFDDPQTWAQSYGTYCLDKMTQLKVDELPLMRSLRGERVNQFEMYIKNNKVQNGRVVSVSSSPITNNDGFIIGAVAVFHDITAQKQEHEKITRLNEEIKQLAYHDPLTDLLNRRGFDELAERVFSDAKRHKRKLAVFYLDLDNFKDINDTYGHETGDKVLKEVSKVLNDSLRTEDLIGRFGGDEFVILSTGLNNTNESKGIADKIIKNLSAYEYNVKGEQIKLKISIGISVYPQASDDYQELVKFADIALYRAKKICKGSYQIFRNSTLSI